MKDESSNVDPAISRVPNRREGVDRRVGMVLVVLVTLTVLFLGLSILHKQPMDTFELRAASFAGFEPRMDGWAFERRPVSPDPIEPNILCYRVTARSAMPFGDALRAGMSLRLVHGYNVRDCMRIKGYRVEEVRSAERGMRNERPTTDGGPPASDLRSPDLTHPSSLIPPPLPGQLWRMVSPAGVTSLWATVMLRAGAFEATDRDVCSMPFPRVGVPDDPDWSPGGITLDGLRHPVANARRVVRAKWNASRSDLLTFLGFRRPKWVQAEWLTLVAVCEVDAGAGEGAAAASLREVQSAFVRALQEWQKKRANSGSSEQ